MSYTTDTLCLYFPFGMFLTLQWTLMDGLRVTAVNLHAQPTNQIVPCSTFVSSVISRCLPLNQDGSLIHCRFFNWNVTLFSFYNIFASFLLKKQREILFPCAFRAPSLRFSCGFSLRCWTCAQTPFVDAQHLK